jgi:GH25 family lysozyme M1 (1,4-beta-N-acetylmuramidase)
VIPWDKVVTSGFTLAYLKCSEGATETDPRFTANVAASEAAGVKWGAYHFVTTTDGDAQWSNARAALNASQLPPCLDVEEIAGATNAAVWVQAYKLLMQLLGNGQIPLIYTNRDMAKTLMTLPGLAKLFGLCPLWLADYETSPGEAESAVTTPAPWAGYMWRQYTAAATIAGVEGIDMSVAGDSAIRWLELTSK